MFLPDCNHTSEKNVCRFFGFPSQKKKNDEFKRWLKLLRRADRLPGEHSRVCSCHFRNGVRDNGPEIFTRNEDKMFSCDDHSRPKRPKKATPSSDRLTTQRIQEIVQDFNEREKENVNSNETSSRAHVILDAELAHARKELEKYKEKESYQRKSYAVSSLSDEIMRMETGLPTKEVFYIVVNYALRFKDSIKYHSGWTVNRIAFEDQIFITLMKVRQNYTNLHLAQLFSCSVSTISNIVITFVHVLHRILFKDLMTTIPSRYKNSTCAPTSFSQFNSCRIVIDCTDIEIATPKLMSQQSATYSSYRGMNSFKALVGVAPNAVITFVSPLFPGSTSDKAIVEKSGFLNHLQTGDMVLADKGFLIQDIVPNGVSVNIPPFLYNAKFTESEAIATKAIAKCRIHVERANARLKDFKILTFVPPYLRCYSDTLFQLCAALVNLQFPLIKEISQDASFE